MSHILQGRKKTDLTRNKQEIGTRNGIQINDRWLHLRKLSSMKCNPTFNPPLHCMSPENPCIININFQVSCFLLQETEYMATHNEFLKLLEKRDKSSVSPCLLLPSASEWPYKLLHGLSNCYCSVILQLMTEQLPEKKPKERQQIKQGYLDDETIESARLL